MIEFKHEGSRRFIKFEKLLSLPSTVWFQEWIKL